MFQGNVIWSDLGLTSYIETKLIGMKGLHIRIIVQNLLYLCEGLSVICFLIKGL